MKQSAHRRAASRRGFTLIEALIVVAIAAILAAIAYPSFRQSVFKGRRADAVAAISVVQQAQERYRANHSEYASSFADPGMGTSLAASRDGHYTLSLSIGAVKGTTYTVMAVPNSSSPQAQDLKCASMAVTMNAGNFTYSATDSSSADSSAQCWAK
ncbi:MAG: type IV pilin protein [Burkholderiales bacterium]|nr:type IV pilin protein [Burkholderiales bacterium]